VPEIKFEGDGAGKSLRKEKVTEAEAEVSISAKMGRLQAGQPNVEEWEESMNTSISATFDSPAVNYRPVRSCTMGSRDTVNTMRGRRDEGRRVRNEEGDRCAVQASG
jgi:hypothetical protein